MENKTQDKGFTLVELLIVIVILGILATVTVFAVRGITEKGEDNACQTDKATFETASEAWYALDSGERFEDGALGGIVTSDGHPLEADLVLTQLIREPSTKIDIQLVAVGDNFVQVVPDGTVAGTVTVSACTTAQLA